MGFGYKNSFQLIDKGVIEAFGPSGFAFHLKTFSKIVALQQSGFIFHYALLMMISLLFFLSSFFFVALDIYKFTDATFVGLLLSYFLYSLNSAASSNPY